MRSRQLADRQTDKQADRNKTYTAKNNYLAIHVMSCVVQACVTRTSCLPCSGSGSGVDITSLCIPGGACRHTPQPHALSRDKTT